MNDFSFTTLLALLDAMPENSRLDRHLTSSEASTLYNGTGGDGNLPSTSSGKLTIYKEMNNGAYIEYWRLSSNEKYYSTYNGTSFTNWKTA